MTSVAVLGAGGVGGLLAAALTRARVDTTLVAREQTAQRLAQTGLTVRSALLGDFTETPAVTTTLTQTVDVLLIATKATGMQDALERVTAAPELVVPLLNGLDHLPLLRRRFGADRVCAAAIRVESDRPQTGVIVQTSPGVRVDLAADDFALAGQVDGAAQLLERAGLSVRRGDSEVAVMWSKLCRLCTLALTTSAADRPIGEIRTDPRWRSAMVNAAGEVAEVAIAEGAPISADAVIAELEAAHASLGSSMQRDIAAGREPELDAIAGSVVRAGARHGLRCPTIQWLAEQVALRAAATRAEATRAEV